MIGKTFRGINVKKQAITQYEFEIKKYKNYNLNLEKLSHKKRIPVVLKLVGSEKRVLDVAAADGTISKLIKENNNEVYAFDICKNKVSHMVKNGIKATVWNVNKTWSYKNGFFDVVFAGEIIEHMYDIDFLLKEAYRVLKKGGHLIITTPNLCSLSNRFRILMGRYPIHFGATLGDDHGWHIRAFNYKTLKKAVERRGFKNIKIYGSISYGIRSEWIGRKFPTLSEELIVDAIKPED